MFSFFLDLYLVTNVFEDDINGAVFGVELGIKSS